MGTFNFCFLLFSFTCLRNKWCLLTIPFRRRVADEIVASISNTQEDEVEAERDDNEASDGEAVGATTTAGAAAAARKKPKRRRY